MHIQYSLLYSTLQAFQLNGKLPIRSKRNYFNHFIILLVVVNTSSKRRAVDYISKPVFRRNFLKNGLASDLSMFKVM